MGKSKQGYSSLIRPLQLILDYSTILLVLLYVADKQFLNTPFLAYIFLCWTFSTFFIGYYRVYRYTSVLTACWLFIKQAIVFTFCFFAFFGLFREGLSVGNQFLVLTTIFLSTFSLKILEYYMLRIYRRKGKNFRVVVVLGCNNSTKRVTKLFYNKPSLGYKYLGFFTDLNENNKIGDVEESFPFMIENSVDEIYCSLIEFDKEQIRQISRFAMIHNMSIKLIPDFDQLYSKVSKVEYYDDSLMVLSVKKLPFEFLENHAVKRGFDVVFSLFTCVLILSWLYPLLWVLIKLESKGPLLFKQTREGINGNEFLCYKFRSMKVNKMSDKIHASKHDPRVTKLGSFMRKTSIDEIPQFLNVLKGDMSVVGPRPHIEALSKDYQDKVDDYLKRHAMRPGITGLAQVSGYRGEVKNKSDIKNRVRLDIFYIENWSFLLDIKIILMTLFNVFKGDEKAY
jgi:putative colanic acid biosynthesis UDP-glucose lipid carrier transferase